MSTGIVGFGHGVFPKSGPALQLRFRAFVKPQTAGLQTAFLTPDTRFVGKYPVAEPDADLHGWME